VVKLVALRLVVPFALFVAVELTPVPVMDGVVALAVTEKLELTPVPVERGLVALAVFENLELTPVPVALGLVALAVTENPELAVVVPFAVIGAECVWITAVPFSVHKLVKVV